MKPFIIITIIGSIVACGFASQQVKPSEMNDFLKSFYDLSQDQDNAKKELARCHDALRDPDGSHHQSF